MQYNRITIYLSGFLFSIPIALMLYINSSFLSSYMSEKLVGITYALGSILSIFALLVSPQIFRKIGGYKFLLLVIFLDVLSILFLTLSLNLWVIILAFVFGFAFNTLIFFSLDELLKIFSEDSQIGRIRGIYLTVCHIALIASQFLSGTILGYFSFREIYGFAFLVMSVFFIFSLFKLKNIPDPKYDNLRTLQFIKEFFKNKNLSRAYVMSFLIQFFYCWMIIYTPIYLHNHIGFAWDKIGIIFAIMLIPFIFIPFNMGKYGDRVGERKLLIYGFFIIALATLSLFLIKSQTVWIWALLLFMTRVGASTIEVMSDAYFFKHIKPESEEFIGVFRSALPLAFVVGPLFATMIFIFIPSFKFIYIILGGIMLSGIYVSSKIEKGDM